MLVCYEMTTVTVMVMRRKRLKRQRTWTCRICNFLSQIWNQNITACMYGQFQLSMCLFN